MMLFKATSAASGQPPYLEQMPAELFFDQDK